MSDSDDTNLALGIVYRTWLAGSSRRQIVDVSPQAYDVWQPNASAPASYIMRPSTASESSDGSDHSTGFAYKSGVTAGQTGAVEPAWPTTAGGTVQDGSVTWTAAAPPVTGGDAIASAVWSQLSPPDGTLTISSQTYGPLTASAYIGGGTSGNVYTVQVVITMTSGAIYVAQIVVTIV